MKSQSALEFMTVVAMGLLILAITSALGMQGITSYSSDVNTINAKQTVNNLISATKLAYSQGVGSQTQVFITVPDRVSQNRTYLYNGEVNYRIEDDGLRDIHNEVGIKTYGTLPILGGKTSVFIRLNSAVLYSLIIPELEAGAYYYLDVADEEVSLILIETYNVSANLPYSLPSNIDQEFSSTENMTYAFVLFNKNDTAVIKEVEISIFKPDGSLYEKDTITTNWFSDTLSIPAGNPGHWLISVKVPEINAVGTTLFYMED